MSPLEEAQRRMALAADLMHMANEILTGSFDARSASDMAEALYPEVFNDRVNAEIVAVMMLQNGTAAAVRKVPERLLEHIVKRYPGVAEAVAKKRGASPS